MSMKFKTQYKPEEIKEILQKNIKRSAFLNWWGDVYIGSVSKHRFRYCFHKAYMKNSFNKDIIGRVYEENGDTYIKVQFISGLLNYRVYLYIHIFMGIVLGFNCIGDTNYTVLEIMYRLAAGGFIFSPFILFIGLIVTILPTPITTKESLIALIKDKLQTEEING